MCEAKPNYSAKTVSNVLLPYVLIWMGMCLGTLSCGGVLSSGANTTNHRILSIQDKINKRECADATKLARNYGGWSNLESKLRRADLEKATSAACNLLVEVDKVSRSSSMSCRTSLSSYLNDIHTSSNVPYYFQRGDYLSADFVHWLVSVAEEVEKSCAEKQGLWLSWKAAGVDDESLIEEWQTFGFTPDDASEWVSEDIAPEDANHWRELSFIPKEASAVISLSLSEEEAVSWLHFFEHTRKNNLSKAEIVKWLSSPIRSDEALSWYRVTSKLEKVLQWHKLGLSPVDYDEWSSDFDAQSTQQWLNHKFTRIEAGEWHELSPETAAEWRDAGFTADEAVFFQGYSFREAKRANKRIFRQCKQGVNHAGILTENPYVLKGRCVLAEVENFQLLNAKTGLYTEVSNEVNVYIRHTKAVPMRMVGIFKIKDGLKYTNTLGAPQIVPLLTPIAIQKQ